MKPSYIVPLSPERRAAVSDSLSRKLKATTNPKARLKILYNLYDLSPEGPERIRIAETLFQTAKAADDSVAMLDAMRVQALSAIGNDSIQAVMEHRAETFAPTPLQRETLTVIRLYRARTAAANPNEKKRLEDLHNTMLRFDTDDKVDVYRRIEMLFTLCIYLQDRTNSYLLNQYLAEVRRLVDGLPSQTGNLRRLFYSQAARLYTLNMRRKQGLQCDSVMLTLFDKLEASRQAEGRHYTDFDALRHATYRRMLANYKEMGEGQAEDIYRYIREIAQINPYVSGSIDRLFLTESYVAMARHDYRSAVTYLRKAIANPDNEIRQYLLLTMLIEAATQTGDREALLEAYSLITPILEKRADSIDDDRIMEHEILRDMHALEANNESLNNINKDLESRSHRRLIFGLAVGAVILTLLLIWLLIALRRTRRAVDSAAHAADMLRSERDALQHTKQQLIKARDDARVADRVKTDFINTISHEISEPINAILGYTQLIVDGIDERRRVTYERFLNIIDINAQLLRTLVNDVLDVSELENSQVSLKFKNIPMAKLARIAAEPMRPRLHDEVSLNIIPLDPERPDVTVDTDPARIEQVLTNLISNAVKFTEKGRIDILYGIEGPYAVFKVRDTGPGIPPEKQKTIFNRFGKLDHYSQGFGLGLHICKLVAQLLDGDVFIDPDYTDGACFVFRIPTRRASVENRPLKSDQ